MKGFSFLYISVAIRKARITIQLIRIFSIILLSFSSFYGLAQDGLLYDQFTIEDGLPSNEIFQTIQDDNGDLWACSNNGLIIFDGINRRTLTTEDGLPGNTIFKAFKDPKNRLWFTSLAHGIFWIRNDSINIPVFNNTLVDSLKSRWIDKLYVDENDTVWMATYQTDTAYYKAHIDDDDFITVNIGSPKLCMDAVYFLLKGEEAILCGSSTAHLFYSSANCLEDTVLFEASGQDSLLLMSNSARRALNPKISITLASKFKHRVYFANDGKELKWVSVRNQLFKIVNGKPILQERFDTDIIDIYLDDNYLIVSTGSKGIFVYDRVGEEIKLKGNYFKKSVVSHTYKDNQGYYWLSIVYEGLVRVTSFDIQDFDLSFDFTQEKRSNNQWFYKNDSLRIVSDSKLLILKRKDKSFETLDVLDFPDMDSTAPISTVAWDAQGRLLFKSCRWDYRRGVLDTILKGNLARPKKIYVDAENNYIYWGDNGYQIWNETSLLFSSNELDFEERPQAVLILEPDHHLVAGIKTLYEFKDEKYVDLGEQNAQLKVRIDDIQLDAEGRVWMATKGSGIYVYTEDTLVIINSDMGLSSNFVLKIWCFEGQVFAATNNGLNRITESETYNFSMRTVLNMETGGPWYTDNIFDTDDGIFLHGAKSIARVEDSYLQDNPGNLSMRITDLEIEGISYFEQIKELPSLDPNQKNIELFFRTNTLKSQLYPTVFRYRLKGLTENWQTTFDTKVRYNDLQPKKYEFEIQARSASGQWSDPEILNFLIQKPLYKRNWFIFSILLFGIGLAILYLNLKKRQVERSRELIFANIKALKNQMNPHFIFNALNSIQYYMATNQKREANIFLSKLSDLVRNVLDTTNQSTISVAEEVGRISDYLELEKMRLDHAFEFKIEFQEGLDQNQTQIPPMLLQPIAENAIWHGLQEIDYPGLLTLNFSMQDANLLVEITDNGQGMDIERWKMDPNNFGQGNSIGLANILQRMKLMSKIKNKDFQISFKNLETKPVKGTQIILTIPQ